MASEEHSLLPRSTAADYEFLEKLGRGNSGTVFKVRRRSDRKFYVVKQVRSHD
jgi:serine/threonine protein kinase